MKSEIKHVNVTVYIYIREGGDPEIKVQMSYRTRDGAFNGSSDA